MIILCLKKIRWCQKKNLRVRELLLPKENRQAQFRSWIQKCSRKVFKFRNWNWPLKMKNPKKWPKTAADQSKTSQSLALQQHRHLSARVGPSQHGFQFSKLRSSSKLFMKHHRTGLKKIRYMNFGKPLTRKNSP